MDLQGCSHIDIRGLVPWTDSDDFRQLCGRLRLVVVRTKVCISGRLQGGDWSRPAAAGEDSHREGRPKQNSHRMPSADCRHLPAPPNSVQESPACPRSADSSYCRSEWLALALAVRIIQPKK